MRKPVVDSRDVKLMSETARDRTFSDLVKATRSPPNGEIRSLEVRIQEFERAEGMDSATMRRLLDAGEIAETSRICSWLMALKLRERLVERQARAD